MARKLPATFAGVDKSKTSTSSSKNPRPSKKVKSELIVKHEPAEKDSTRIELELAKQSNPVPLPHHRSRTRLRDDRSLSTSPPPAPPPVELMHAGLDEDDIYMLVEDEFQEIAQSYTGHLHHAEYKRLMKLARERKAEQQRAGLDFLGGEGIPDNVSGEAKQRLQRGLLKERQESGLKTISGGGLLDGSDEESGEEAREAVLAREEMKVGNMWAGTALSGLMSWDHSQEKTSLRGLEKISGETRASKGFGPSKKRYERQGSGEVEIKRERHSKADDEHKKSRPIGTNDTKSSTTTKSTGKSTHVSEKMSFTRFYTEPAIGQSKISDNEASSTRQESKPTKVVKSRYRSLIDSLDDFDDAAFDATQQALKDESPKESRSRNFSAPSKEKRKRDRKDRLDEVPVFLY